MTHQAALLAVHWFYAAFFAAFGSYLLWRPQTITNTVCGMRLGNDDQRARMEAAVKRRREAEHISDVTGYVVAAVTFAISFIAAFTSVPDALLYAVFCMTFALASAAVFLQLRNSSPTRVAMLTPRVAESVIPRPILAAAALSVFLPLTDVREPGLGVAAIVVVLSSALTLAAAWRLTRLPALLQGVDLPMETALDDRARFIRCSRTLVFAVAQPLVLCAQAPDNTPLQNAAFFASFAILICVAVWLVQKQFRTVSLNGA